MQIQPAWNASASPFRHSWKGVVNIDQFRWMTRRDVQEQLEMARDELGARHVRAVGMFDDELRVLTRLAGGKEAAFNSPLPQRPNWQIVDYIVDSLLDRGLSPMFTTTFMPGVLASGERTVFSTKGRISLPRDWRAWRALVGEGVRHAIGRYGLEIVRGWYFEVWNEPNLENAFFEGNQADFFRLWRETFAAIKEVEPSLRVGGPSAARGDWVRDLIIWGRENGCDPDYVITHIYNNDSEWAALSPFDGPQADKASKSPHFAAGVMRGVRRELDEISFGGELHWNEWGRSWLPHDPQRETPNEAAFIVKTMSETSQLADYFAYWCLSDVYDQVGYGRTAFHGNYGLLNLQGLRKPAYHAFELLGQLGDARLPVSSSDFTPLCGAIATQKPQNGKTCEGAVLIYEFDENWSPEATPNRRDVRLHLPRGARNPRLFRVNAHENNVLFDWRELGSPEILSRGQTAELRAQNALQESRDAVSIRESHAHFAIETPGVALLLFDFEV